MELTLDEHGNLVGEDGKVFQVDGEPIKVANAKRQDDVDRAFATEKARHREKVEQLNGQIRALETQASKSAEVQAMLDTLKGEKADLEGKLRDAEKQASERVASQLQNAQRKAAELEERLQAEMAARVRDQVTNALLAAAKDQFNEPAIDVVPHLLGTHKREPKKDADGKDTGEFVDLFKLTHKGDDGKEITDLYPAEKALEIWASQHPHHVRASNQGGSGGGHYGPASQNAKRSEMSAGQKAAFVGKHGLAAFQALPE